MKIGILGGGQLARMLSLAAYPLGMRTICFEPTPDTCANNVTRVINASFSDQNALEKFAKQVDVVTFETENIPFATAEFINQLVNLQPSLQALAICQERGREKNLFRELAIDTPRFVLINSFADLTKAVAEIGLPAVLKTRRMGYDGKGQIILRDAAALADAWQKINSTELILEQFVNFDREVSILAVRGKNKTTRFYPLVENQHFEGILRLSLAPCMDEVLQTKAQLYAQRILDYFDYVGMLAIEFFQVGERLLANEMAPRVHNSGHWTIEGADVSQFENHLRAITDLPLGSTQARGFSAMLNCIGEMPERKSVLQVAEAHYHSYEKSAAFNRKVGHVTINTADQQLLQTYLKQFIDKSL